MVSVVIPIYNVKRFIDRGLNSVLNQTYADLEIILSDDGSTDGSYDECIRWSKLDNRIKVISQENKGAGAARNHGIEVATGDYIYFFDIDDEINPKLIDYCVDVAERNDAELVVLSYENVETTYVSKTIVRFRECLITSNSELRDVFVDEFVMKVNGFPWNKFYKREFLNNNHLRYENQRIQQDEVFNLKCYQKINRVYLSSEVLYTYYVYESGNTRTRFIPDRFDIILSVRQHFENVKKHWNLNDVRLDEYLEYRFFDGVVSCMMYNLNHPDCTWNYNQVKMELSRILDNPITIQSFNHVRRHSKFSKRFFLSYVCNSRNITLINLYHKISNNFSLFRKNSKK